MDIPSSVSNLLGQSTNTAADTAANALSFVGNPGLLVGAIILIVIAIVLIVLLKKIIENSILGIIAWAILTFVFAIKLPFWASLIVSAIFGLAGLGVLLVLRFLGVL